MVYKKDLNIKSSQKLEKIPTEYSILIKLPSMAKLIKLTNSLIILMNILEENYQVKQFGI